MALVYATEHVRPNQAQQLAQHDKKQPQYQWQTSSSSIRNTTSTKDHHDWIFNGKWGDTPGPGSYSPAAQMPTGGGHGGKKIQSIQTLGSPCFATAAKKQKDKWFGNNDTRKRPIMPNRLVPYDWNKKSYPKSLCTCVALEEAPDKTRCPFCRHRVPSYELEQHYTECPHHPLPCPYCHEEYKRKHLNLHIEEDCGERPVPCEWCHENIKQMHMSAHRDLPECPAKPVTCEYCGIKITFSRYNAHVQNCENRPSQCPYCKQAFPYNMVEPHSAQCDHRPVKCRYCSANLAFADARSHRDVCPEKPQDCAQCGKKVIKSQLQMHSLGCALISKANLILPRLRPVCGVVIDVTNGDNFHQEGGVLVQDPAKTQDKKPNPRRGSPGELSGIKAMDRIFMLDDHTTYTNADFKQALQKHIAGDIVQVHVHRNFGEPEQQQLVLSLEIGATFVDPRTRESVLYSQEDVRTIRRIREGLLQDSDIRVEPHWAKHADLLANAGPETEQWAPQRRGSRHAVTRKGPRQLGMITRNAQSSPRSVSPRRASFGRSRPSTSNTNQRSLSPRRLSSR